MISLWLGRLMVGLQQLFVSLAKPFRWVFALFGSLTEPARRYIKSLWMNSALPVLLPVWRRGEGVWQNLAPREQKVIGGGFFLVVICLCWLLVWDPLYQAKQRVIKQLPLLQVQQNEVSQAVATIQAQGGIQEKTVLSQQMIIDAFYERQIEVDVSSNEQDRVWRLQIKQASWAVFYDVWRQLHALDESVQIESLRLESIKNTSEDPLKNTSIKPQFSLQDPNSMKDQFVITVSFVRSKVETR